MGQEKARQQSIPSAEINPSQQPQLSLTQHEGAPRTCDLPALFALLLYLGLSIAFFGRSLFGNLSVSYIGVGPDPALMMWSLVWWPHALIEGINPFLTGALFAPSGLNLTWQTAIPFASAIATPLTLTAGPIVAYNILCLASLTLDAWCTFVLCRYLSRHFWASVCGGFVFGFSAFFLGHLLFGDLHMLLAASLPLSAYLIARRLAGDITQRRLILLLTPLLIAQFLQSLEMFATMTLCGAIALVFGYIFASHNAEKARILSLLKPIVVSYALVFIIISPYLYFFVAFGFTSGPVWPPYFFNADPLNFIVPTQTDQIGLFPLFVSLSTKFPGGSIAENGSYLGLPLIMIATLYARQHWREPLGRLLIDFLAVVCILSLGPALHVAGRMFPVYLPWRLFDVPPLNNAMSVRFSVYADLDLAIIASLWFSNYETNRSLKLAIGISIVVFNLPNLSAKFWSSTLDTPGFFRNGLYQKYLTKGETVLILPYGQNGNAMLWQAQADMYFNMAEGGAGVRMEESRRWPIVGALEKESYIPQALEQLELFRKAHGVAAIIVTDADLGTWRSFLSELGVPAVRVGNVSLYRFSAGAERDRDQMLLDARTRFDEGRLRELVVGTNRYLSRGGSLDSLTALGAPDLQVIPRESLVGPKITFDPSLSPRRKALDPRLAFGVWLGPQDNNRVSVGEYAWYPCVRGLIEKFRPVASAIYFLDPSAMSPESAPSPRDGIGFLLLIFTREQLAHAAELLRPPTAQKTSAVRNFSTVPSHALILR